MNKLCTRSNPSYWSTWTFNRFQCYQRWLSLGFAYLPQTNNFLWLFYFNHISVLCCHTGDWDYQCQTTAILNAGSGRSVAGQGQLLPLFASFLAAELWSQDLDLVQIHSRCCSPAPPPLLRCAALQPVGQWAEHPPRSSGPTSGWTHQTNPAAGAPDPSRQSKSWKKPEVFILSDQDSCIIRPKTDIQYTLINTYGEIQFVQIL